MPPDGTIRYAQRGGDLLIIQAGKVAHFDNPYQLAIHLCELVQRLVDANDLVFRTAAGKPGAAGKVDRGFADPGIERDSRLGSASTFHAASSHAVHYDGSPDTRRVTEKLRPAG